jgi:hypothetical protein
MISVRLRVMLALIGAAFVFGSSQTLAAQEPVIVGSIPASVQPLMRAAALGVLVRIDPKRHEAEFRISCGWHYAPKTKIRRGLWKVSLRRLRFGWETNLANPAAGHVETVSLSTWETRATTRGWRGTLRLSDSGGGLSNGPTTDICAGVLG